MKRAKALELYEKLVATSPKVERKGDTMPYTSLNGHRFSLFTKENKLTLRPPGTALPRDMTTQFIQHPSRSGMFGALMDEYSRAAEDFCRVVEAFDDARFDNEKPGNSVTTRSPRILSAHVCGATHRYAHYIRKARGVEYIDRYDVDPSQLASSRDIRPRLVEGLTFTESTVEPLRDATDAEVRGLSFPVRWSPQQYDPEMILEHAICHLLRHRRQLERW